MEDIDEFLRKIESKYSTNSNISPENEVQEQLLVLSEEFSTLGLSSINVKQSDTRLLQEIASNALLLIQIHRKTLSHLSDANIHCRYKDTKSHDMEKNVLNLKKKVLLIDSQNKSLEMNITRLNRECSDLKKVISGHKQETDKIKHFYKSKLSELTHNINNLKNENHHLKELCGKDVDKHFSKDDKFLKVLKKYKQNEVGYKDALQKLEDNNTEVMSEILNLKAELALACSKRE